MTANTPLVAALAVLAFVAGTAHATPFAPNVTQPKSITAYRNMTQATKYGTAHGVLYAVEADGYTDGPVIVADLHGDNHYDVGYAYGVLLAEETVANYHSLLGSLLGGSSLLADVLDLFLDWQYDSYLRHGLNDDFLSELQGVEDGGASVNRPYVGAYVRRGLVLASIATGDVKFDVETLVKDEFSKHGKAARDTLRGSPLDAAEVSSVLSGLVTPLGNTCSMFGVWGNRSADGLVTGRNLDWTADTGVSKYKTVTVYHIAGRQTYASVSFAAFIGAITGMSEPGLTVHEAGDDNTRETLTGFAWALRLRLVMENATNLDEARKLWESTNNTLGLNHGIGSAADDRFMALETAAGYTAYFFDNDAREAASVVDGTHVGFPMENALWRTNHGYDPTFLKTAKGPVNPKGDSETRYLLIHDTIKMYEDMGKPVDDMMAINITAVAGDKGGSTRSTFVRCGAAAAGGSNIISATFHPGVGHHMLYLAFEDGHGDNHVPACCNNYISLNMTQFWNTQPSL